jgi:hypothetical protein
MPDYLDYLYEEDNNSNDKLSYLNQELGEDNEPLKDSDMPDFRTTSRSIDAPTETYGDNLESYQDYLGTDINVLRDDLDELRAQAQSVPEKFAMGVGRVGTKALIEAAKTPGYLLGFADWAATGFEADELKRMTNNAWVENLDKLDEAAKEALPVYVKEAVKNGNLWDNLSSIDFWATEGADGIGFLLGMMAPGGVTKLLGLGGKLARGTNALVEGFGILPGTLAKKAPWLLTKNAANLADTGIATITNTIAEAGAEAGSTMKGLEGHFRKLVDNGVINEATGKPWTEEEAQLKIGEAGRNTFLTNVAILLGPNALTQANLMKAFGGKTGLEGVLSKSKFIDEATGQLAKETGESALGSATKRVGISMFSEGFFEEGGQFAAEDYWSKVAKGETDSDFLTGMAESYVDALTTTEGQKSIALGAILGGVMGGGVSTYKQAKADEALLESLKKNYSSFEKQLTDVYKKDDKGNIIVDEEGNPVKDYVKVAEAVQSLRNNMVNSDILDKYIKAGNREGAEFALNEAFTSMAMPYLEMDGGLDILDANIDALAESVSKELEMPKSEIAETLKKSAKDLKKQKDYLDLYENDYFKIRPENKAHKKYIPAFIDYIKSSALKEGSRQRHLNTRIAQLENELLNLNQSPEINEREIKNIEKQLETYNKDLKMSIADVKNLYNKELQNKAFLKFAEEIDNLNKTAEEVESKEKTEKEVPVGTTDDLKNLFTDHTIVETTRSGKKVTHSDEFSIESDAPIEIKDDAGNTQDNLFKIIGFNNTGNITVEHIPSGKKGYINSDNTFRFDGNVYTNPSTITKKNALQSKKEYEGNIFLETLRGYIDQFNQKAEQEDQKIEEYSLKIKNATEAVKRAIKNTTKKKEGKAWLVEDGKRMVLTASAIEDIIQEYKDIIRKAEIRKAEFLNKAEETFIDVEELIYNQEKTGLIAGREEILGSSEAALRKNEEMLARAQSELSKAEKVLRRLKGLLKGLYTSFRGLVDEFRTLPRKAKKQALLGTEKIRDLEEFTPETYDRILDAVVKENSGMKTIVSNVQKMISKIIPVQEEVDRLSQEIQELEEEGRRLRDEIRRGKVFLDKFENLYDELANEYKEPTPIAENVDEGFEHEYVNPDAVDFDEVEAEERRTGSAEPRPRFENFKSFFRTTPNKTSKAWNKFMDEYDPKLKIYQLTSVTINTIPKGLEDKIRFYIPSKKANLLVSEMTDADKKEALEDIKLLVTKKKGNKAHEVDGELVYTSMAQASYEMEEIDPATGKPYPRFDFRNKREQVEKEIKSTNEDIKEDDLKKEVDKRLKEDKDRAIARYTEIRNKASKGNLVFPILHKNPGKRNAGALKGAVNVLYKENKKGGPKNKAIQFLSMIVAKSSLITVGGRVYKTQPGVAYIEHHGRPEFMHNKTLNESGDVNKVLGLLELYASIKGDTIEAKAERRQVRDALQSVVNMTNAKAIKEGKGGSEQNRLYFRNKGTELVFGNKTITSEELMSSKPSAIKQELTDFLGTKYHHVHAGLLSNAPFKEYIVKDGKLHVKKTWKSEEGGYKAYLLAGEKGLFTLEPYSDTIPQYENSSMQYDVPGATNKKPTPTKKDTSPKASGTETTPKAEPAAEEAMTDFNESDISGDIADILAMADAAEAAGAIKGDKIESEEETEEEELSEEELNGSTLEGEESETPEERRAREEAAADQNSDYDPFFDLSHDTVNYLEEDQADLPKELQWFKNKFPGIPIKQIAGLIEGKALGRLTKDLEVLISDLAVAGTTYHEAFHVVSQAFFSPEERERMYNEVRERLKNTTVNTYDKKSLKGSQLSDRQVEEFLAEEFRDYMLSKENYKFNKGQETQKTLFRRILDLVKNFFNSILGKENESENTIEQIFNNIRTREKFELKDLKGNPITNFDSRVGALTTSQSMILLADLNHKFFDTILNFEEYGIKTVFELSEELDKEQSNIKTAIYQKIRDTKLTRIKEDGKRVRAKGVNKEYLTNYNSLVKEHTRFLRQYGIVLPEDIDEDNITGKDKTQFKESNQFSALEFMPSAVKLLIASLPIDNSNDSRLNSKTVNEWNTNSNVQFNKTVSLLHNELANVPSVSMMVDRIKALSTTYPELGTLLSRIGIADNLALENLDKYQTRLLTQFYIQFSKNKNTPIIAIVKGDGNIILMDATDRALMNSVVDKWKNNAKEYSKYFKKDSTGASVLNKEATVEVNEQSYKIKDINKDIIATADLESKLNLLEAVGIQINPDFVYEIGTEIINPALNWLYKGINSKDKVTADDIFSRDIVQANKEINALAVASAAQISCSFCGSNG